MGVEMKYSIIVPVYNVEKYIDVCLNSLLKQKTDNYEIILVDDGSRDSSGKICDHVALKYENIQVIHQINQGLSEARNTGIKAANGEYLIFVDSDDCLAENALLNLDMCIENDKPDVIVVPSKTFKNEVTDLTDYNIVNKDLKMHRNVMNEYLKILNNRKFTITAWSFVVRRRFLINEGLEFEKGLLHEDDLWTHLLLLKAKSLKYQSEPFYNYRLQRKDSIMNTIDIKHLESYIKILDKIVGDKKENEKNELCRKKMATIYLTFFNTMLDMDVKEAWIINKFNEYNYLLRYDRHIWAKAIWILNRILGVSRTLQILRIMKKNYNR